MSKDECQESQVKTYRIEVPAEHWRAAEDAVEKCLRDAEDGDICEVYWQGFSAIIYRVENCTKPNRPKY